MIIVILAAGKGNRLKKTLPNSFDYKTKALIPINNEPAIKRLFKQFLKVEENNLILTLGHQHKSILEVFNHPKPKYVLNNNYINDSNLRSLFLAFNKIIEDRNYNLNKGILVIEADCYFSDQMLINFIDHINQINSTQKVLNMICWTTKGYAKIDDSGGFVDPFKNLVNTNNGRVNNVYIKSKPNSSNTLKMYGITWFNNNAAIEWHNKAKIYLKNKNSADLTGYFHEIIFKNIESYSMRYYDLGSKALSFNNFREYSKCQDIN